MTRDEIEEFSGVMLNCFETDREEDWYKIGCIDGLDAADAEPNLESLWHDASKEPRCDELLLGEDTYGFNIYRWCGQDNWEAFVNETGLSRWAYINDLLPKQFGNFEQPKGGDK